MEIKTWKIQSNRKSKYSEKSSINSIMLYSMKKKNRNAVLHNHINEREPTACYIMHWCGCRVLDLYKVVDKICYAKLEPHSQCIELTAIMKLRHNLPHNVHRNDIDRVKINSNTTRAHSNSKTNTKAILKTKTKLFQRLRLCYNDFPCITTFS